MRLKQIGFIYDKYVNLVMISFDYMYDYISFIGTITEILPIWPDKYAV